MKKIILTLASFAAFMLISIFLSAQGGGTIKGVVINNETGKPVPFATVSVKYGDQLIGTTTDLDGNYTIKPVPAGEYVVTAQMTGWSTADLAGVSVYQEKITFADDIKLAEGINLRTLVINGDDIREVDPSLPKTMNNIETNQIPERRDLNGILAVMSSEIQVSDDREEVYFRGSRNGDAIYYIDGIRMRDSKNMCPSMAIGSIMVYTGGVPSKYGDYSGGVVVVETMSYFDWVAQQESKRLKNEGN
ncbi:MAG: carboxypeptidase-like regulatory domain-containing protein [Bacteroidales bacterium]|nr:carboxypeptidase-like regulatory domain-containing protein [Bacteroidales bacterium]